MAYTPSLADINEIDPQPYQPSLADINEIDPQGSITQQPSYLSQLFSKDQPGDLNVNYIASKLAPINAGAAKFGGNIMQDVGSLAKSLGYGEGAPSGADTLQSMGANVAQNANKTFGVIPSTQSNVEEGVSQFAPYMLAAPRTIASQALSSIPGLGGSLLRGLSAGAQGGLQSGALAGATQSAAGQAIPGAIQGATTGLEGGALAGTALPAIGLGLKGMGATWTGAKGLVGGNLQDVSDNLYNTIAGGKDPQELNAINNQSVINNGNAQKARLSNAYTGFSNTVAQNGYATSGAPSTTDFLGQQVGGSAGKFITPTSDITNKLQSILENDPAKTQTSNISAPARGAITDYMSSPTFDNAHNLQSVLGNEAANFKAYNASPADKSAANTLNGLRNDIKTNISNNFKANGDGHLDAAYNDLSADYRQNVAPYQNNSQVWKAMNGGGHIPNVSSFLSKDSDAINGIRQHILQNPDQSQSVLAQAIGKNMGTGLPKDPITGEITTNPKRMVGALNNIQGHTQDFADVAKMNPQIGQVLTQYARKTGLPKKAAWILGGAGLAGGHEAYNKLREML